MIVLTACLLLATAIDIYDKNYKKYPLSFPLKVAFFESATQGSISLYAGYSYELSNFYVFAFDTEKSVLIAEKQYELNGVKSLCEAPDGILLSGAEGSRVLRLESGEFTLRSTTVSCPSLSEAPACNNNYVLFNGLLPGRWDQLSICYDSKRRRVSFHITAADGTHRDLGNAGTSPGKPGRFVVMRTSHPDTFLVHHTETSIHKSAVLVDVSSGALAPFDVPDLSDARPSRGFGAGNFGVRLHPIPFGIIAEGEGGHLFFLKDDRTQRLAENVVPDSVRIGQKGCTVMLVARTDASGEFRIYDLCDWGLKGSKIIFRRKLNG